jgi:molybdate transport system substrate-binding protein
MNADVSRISGGALLCLLLAWQPAALLAQELPAQELIVSAAVSLTNAFTELGKAYERDNPGHRLILNFGGSGQLLQQINRGAPVDVFASADQETMSRAQKRNLIVRDSRVDFARNTLVLIAPADSKLEMTDLGQLRTGTVSRIAISNPASVPVGRYSRLALETAGLWKVLAPRFINTQHVRQSLDYVARGEVDVGFVYATDARVRPDRVRVVMEVSTSIPITYPIAVVADTREPDLARHFIAFVKSSRGLAILAKRGFAAP